MKAQHTPGPWTWVKQEFGDGWSLQDAEGNEVANDGSASGEYYDWFSPHGAPDADAVLIAAAPELLDALADMLRTMDQHGCGFEASSGDFWKAVRDARAAIAKATGSDAARDEGGL